MKTEKITSEMLLSLIKEEAKQIKKELNEAEFTKVGEPMDVKLNQQPSKGGSDEKISTAVGVKGGAKKGGDGYTKGQAKANFDSKTKGPKDAMSAPFTEKGSDKLNQQPSKEGSDEKAATAVGVKAGAEKSGNGVTAGQHKANFDSKTKGPKDSVSTPFTEKTSGKMNEEDKVIDDGTKTFVEAGSENGGTNVTAGQHKASWKEVAPKSDSEKRITTAIQLKETYTREELKQFIISESKKIAKRQILEEELAKLKDEISNL